MSHVSVTARTCRFLCLCTFLGLLVSMVSCMNVCIPKNLFAFKYSVESAVFLKCEYLLLFFVLSFSFIIVNGIFLDDEEGCSKF